MFNKDFYPTPKEVVERMLLGTDVSGKVVLEPSAGKGNIISVLKEYGAKEVIACEINNDLAKIAVSKADRFLKDDFLKVTSEEVSHIDFIVMNPPFSRDEDHILHAYEIAPEGCTIISLCNDSILSRSYLSKQEKINKIIELNGRKECFSNCFKDAERRTNVDVACIWIYKPKTGEDEFADFFSLDEEHEQTEAGIQRYNYVRDMVSRYIDAVSRFDNVMNAAKEINDITSPISNYGIKFGAYVPGERTGSTSDITRDTFKKDLQKRCWSKMFNDMKMDKYITRGVKENINKFVEQQVHVPFTMKNVYRMIEIIVGTHDSRMDQVLIEAFDRICSYSWKENCTGGEHWKTNSDYMVNRRFIIPWICDYDTRWPQAHVHLGYGSNRDSIDDIVKALCFMTGTNYDDTTSLYSFVNNMKMNWGSWYNWGFFRIRGYKKGTMHFEFEDEDLWMKFNQRIAKIRGWSLPENVKKKKAA